MTAVVLMRLVDRGVVSLDDPVEHHVPEARADMMRVQTPEDPRRGYGIGFSVEVGEDGRRLVSHGGSVSGYTAHLAFDPDARVAVVLLRNNAGGAGNLGAASPGLVRAQATTTP